MSKTLIVIMVVLLVISLIIDFFSHEETGEDEE